MGKLSYEGQRIEYDSYGEGDRVMLADFVEEAWRT
jgi:hypothetical protein